MAIYMKIDGINGKVTATGHEKWLELYNIDFGVGRGINSVNPGSQTDREASIPSFSEISVTKPMDEAAPDLFIEACLGKAKEVKIHLIRSGDNLQSYMEYTFSNALISNYSVSADSGDGNPTESFALNFDKIQMTYKPFGEGDAGATPVTTGYDLAKGTKV